MPKPAKRTIDPGFMHGAFRGDCLCLALSLAYYLLEHRPKQVDGSKASKSRETRHTRSLSEQNDTTRGSDHHKAYPDVPPSRASESDCQYGCLQQHQYSASDIIRASCPYKSLSRPADSGVHTCSVGGLTVDEGIPESLCKREMSDAWKRMRGKRKKNVAWGYLEVITFNEEA